MFLGVLATHKVIGRVEVIGTGVGARFENLAEEAFRYHLEKSRESIVFMDCSWINIDDIIGRFAFCEYTFIYTTTIH